jgi:hypothetical protein
MPRWPCKDDAVELPSVMAAPFIVGQTDILITLPRLAAQRLSLTASASLHELPFATPTYTPTVCFRARHMNAARHRWLREQLRSALNAASTT